MKSLHEKILEVNKSRTKDAQQRLDRAKGQVEKLSKEISRLTVEIQTSQRLVLGKIWVGMMSTPCGCVIMLFNCI